jgi:concentrative nucleoside transporter, CNT family
MHVAPLLASISTLNPGTLLERSQSLLGLVVFLLVAFIIGFSRGNRTVPWRIVLWGVALQFIFAGLVLFSSGVLVTVQNAVQTLLNFSNEGAAMMFGPNLVKGELPVAGGGFASTGFIFAIIVLPTIIFVSMLTAILYHLGVLQVVVFGLAWVMQKTMKCSGAETLSTAANVFVGQTEAPLIIRPYLQMATRSELFAVMVGGFSNIASGVLVGYTMMLKTIVQDVGGHLAAACLVSAPATLVIAKLIMPETQTPQTSGAMKLEFNRTDANLFDAATRGTSEGLMLALNVGAMLVAFTALVAMLNFFVGGLTGLTIQQLLGYVFAPVMWLVGVPWSEAGRAGSLLGIKTVLNEFFAYLEMSQRFSAQPGYLSPRSSLLTTYALCGFANFASIGIQIGGISSLAPDQRPTLARIALLTMIGGTLATLTGACVVGVLK